MPLAIGPPTLDRGRRQDAPRSPQPENTPLDRFRPLRSAGRELLVIVLGVLIALAADRWMEGVREAGDEERYLSRIAADLDVTVDAVTSQLPRLQLALESNDRLLDPGIAAMPPDSIVALYMDAAKIGISRAQLGSDVAFRELVSSGRLNLLRDPSVRADLAEFYRLWESVVETMTGYDSSAFNVGGLTGFFPYRLSGARAELSPATRARIVAAATEDPEREQRFRAVHANLDHWITRMRGVVSDAEELRTTIR